MKGRTDMQKPVVIYNIEKKEIIGIFSTCAVAARYLFADNMPYNGAYKVRYAADHNGRVVCPFLNLIVAIRVAKKDHLDIIGNDTYKIINKYPEPSPVSMSGFHDTRLSLRKEFDKKHNRIY